MKLLACLIPVVVFAQQPDPRELLKQSTAAMQEYNSYQLESVVAIDMRGGPMNEKLEMPSSIAVKRPGKMRVESKSSAGAITIVSDGEHTWFYLSAAKKYVKRDAVESPDAAVINAGLLPRNLPDLNGSIKSVRLKGEDSIDIGGVKTTCWVVETIFDKIMLPEQGVSVRDGVQLTWIGKDKPLTLQSSFAATINLPGVAEPVEMTQSTHTTKVRLNVNLPDSMFVFTPPAGTKETDDWTLPGITKPDVIGKAAPSSLVLNSKKPITLVLFATPSCAPCERERRVIEKVAAEFGDSGFAVMTPSAGEFPELSVTSFPTIVLIDRDGKIVSYEVGARGELALREDLKKAGIGKR